MQAAIAALSRDLKDKPGAYNVEVHTSNEVFNYLNFLNKEHARGRPLPRDEGYIIRRAVKVHWSSEIHGYCYRITSTKKGQQEMKHLIGATLQNVLQEIEKKIINNLAEGRRVTRIELSRDLFNDISELAKTLEPGKASYGYSLYKKTMQVVSEEPGYSFFLVTEDVEYPVKTQEVPTAAEMRKVIRDKFKNRKLELQTEIATAIRKAADDMRNEVFVPNIAMHLLKEKGTNILAEKYRVERVMLADLKQKGYVVEPRRESRDTPGAEHGARLQEGVLISW